MFAEVNCYEFLNGCRTINILHNVFDVYVNVMLILWKKSIIHVDRLYNVYLLVELPNPKLGNIM